MTNNPWLHIPAADYEAHMTKVGQAQLISKMTLRCLKSCKPASFALLGCSTGNGLEHVDPEITEELYVVDINSEYCKITAKRFGEKLPNMKVYNLDVEKDPFPFAKVDLFFAGLLLEYVDYINVLKKLIKHLKPGGCIAMLVQQSKKSEFVSPTKYTKLRQLSSLSREVNIDEMMQLMKGNDCILQQKEKYQMSEAKSFGFLSWKKIN